MSLSSMPDAQYPENEILFKPHLWLDMTHVVSEELKLELPLAGRALGEALDYIRLLAKFPDDSYPTSWAVYTACRALKEGSGDLLMRFWLEVSDFDLHYQTFGSYTKDQETLQATIDAMRRIGIDVNPFFWDINWTEPGNPKLAEAKIGSIVAAASQTR